MWWRRMPSHWAGSAASAAGERWLRASALKLDALAVQPFEEVLEHLQLRLDVGPGPPRAGVEPGPADLEAAMLGAECRVSGCSDHAPGDAVTRGERDLTSGGGLLEGLFEPVVELLAIGNLSEIPAPYPRVA